MDLSRRLRCPKTAQCTAKSRLTLNLVHKVPFTIPEFLSATFEVKVEITVELGIVVIDLLLKHISRTFSFDGGFTSRVMPKHWL